MTQKPSVGKIVHFWVASYSEPLAAIITRVQDAQKQIVDLMVFRPTNTEPYTSVSYDKRRLPETWTWPEREE